jgi:hypothetical protein
MNLLAESFNHSGAPDQNYFHTSDIYLRTIYIYETYLLTGVYLTGVSFEACTLEVIIYLMGGRVSHDVRISWAWASHKRISISEVRITRACINHSAPWGVVWHLVG